MEEQPQQQQPPQIHHGVLNDIARLVTEERHKLIVCHHCGPPVDRQSLEYLVIFLDDNGDDSHGVTEMILYYMSGWSLTAA
jgi:hypothetical protein